MKPWIIFAISAAATLASASAQAGISASLAKKCREMMVKAHPTVFYGERGTAALQREYFGQCISRHSRMDNQPQLTTNGSGQR